MGVNKYQIGHEESSRVSEAMTHYYNSKQGHSLASGIEKVKTYISQLLEFNGYGKLSIPGSLLPDLPKALGLAAGEMAVLLNISRSKYYRDMEEKELDIDTIDKLSVILQVYEMGIEAFEGEKEVFNVWLHNTNVNLGNVKPIELMVTEKGRQAVLEAIVRIEYNLYG